MIKGSKAGKIFRDGENMPSKTDRVRGTWGNGSVSKMLGKHV